VRSERHSYPTEWKRKVALSMLELICRMSRT
jgi:hypothetical protein